MKDTEGIADLFVGVALIVVHPALHDGHGLAGQNAENQLPLVAGGCGGFKVRDVTIGDDDGVFHFIAQISQAGAQDHRHFGLKSA